MDHTHHIAKARKLLDQEAPANNLGAAAHALVAIYDLLAEHFGGTVELQGVRDPGFDKHHEK